MILGRVRPGFEVEEGPRLIQPVGVPGSIADGVRLMIHTGHYVGADHESVRPHVRVEGIGIGTDHLWGATPVLLDACKAPTSNHLASRTSFCPFLARTEGQLVLVRENQVVWVVIQAQSF